MSTPTSVIPIILLCSTIGCTVDLHRSAFRNSVPAPPRRSLRIALSIEQNASPTVLAEMKRELRYIVRIPSLELRWCAFGEKFAEPERRPLAIVKLLGNCTMRSGEPYVASNGALGLTYVSGGVILHYAALNCDRVRSLVHSVAGHRSPIHQEVLLGRALGRVLAHELYHMLAKTREHTVVGVTKPIVTAQDLTCSHFPMPSYCLDKLKRALSLPPNIEDPRAHGQINVGFPEEAAGIAAASQRIERNTP